MQLPVLTYLELAGRALAVGSTTSTEIAGWRPDTTYRLREVPGPAAPAPRRVQHPQDDHWSRAEVNRGAHEVLGDSAAVVHAPRSARICRG